MASEAIDAVVLPVSGPRVDAIVASRFALDGGAMFGVVPRARWEREWRPDEHHRVALVARALLVRDVARGVCALVDTGLGDVWSEGERDRFAIDRERTHGLDSTLAALGVRGDEVTDVLLTHLHWDHAGGVTRHDADAEHGVALRFARARHHVSRAHLDDAAAATAKDRGSFRSIDLELLARSGLLEVHDAFGEWLPGIEALRSDGHAGGLAILRVGDARGERAVLPADLVPAAPHVRLAWGMAYDNEPRRVVREKAALLEECALRRDLLVFGHDPEIAAARVRSEADGTFSIEPI